MVLHLLFQFSKIRYLKICNLINLKKQEIMMVIDKTWTLFLDRDGVINERIPGDYIKKWDNFVFIQGVLPAIAAMTGVFGRIIVVTNQAGISKGVVTEEAVRTLHRKMRLTVELMNGKIDRVYFSPDLADSGSLTRKPAVGMGHQAKVNFPDIDFSKSIMIGDSTSDMGFGRGLGMTTVFVEGKGENPPADLVDYHFKDLHSFAEKILDKKIDIVKYS